VLVLANIQNSARSVSVKVGARNLSAKLPPQSFVTFCLAALPETSGLDKISSGP